MTGSSRIWTYLNDREVKSRVYRRQAVKLLVSCSLAIPAIIYPYTLGSSEQVPMAWIRWSDAEEITKCVSLNLRSEWVNEYALMCLRRTGLDP
jgi:hypothetical protein